MDFSVASMLAVDGLTNGAIYALLAMTIVLVFSVTRVLFLAQGEFVVLGAMSMAQFAVGKLPAAVWLLAGLLIAAIGQETLVAIRRRDPPLKVCRSLFRIAAFPLASLCLTFVVIPLDSSLMVKAMLSLALVAPMGPLLYRLVYSSLAAASVLTLLIVSVGVHFVLTGLGLAFFGPEGYRTPAFIEASWDVAGVPISAQAVVIVGMAVALIASLFGFFMHTFRGMSLRATAVNALGARIVGLSTETAGETSFALAAAIGALSGVLIGSTTTIYYDTGFLIGLKGFVAAVFAGLASFPGALLGALVVGLIESFGSFWSSAFKESIVFAAVIPILLWRSIFLGTTEEH